MKNIQKATKKDLDSIMEVIEDARLLLKQNSSFQWNQADGYPTRKDILKDIQLEQLYVYKEKETVLGTIVIMKEIEHDYDKIYAGSWLTTGSYYTIHRIAVRNNCHKKHIGEKLMIYAEELAKKNNVYSIRFDTMKNNLAMQKRGENLGYKACGIIYLSRSKENNERLAYEKKLSD